jgi:rhodanese-related sulfurtransferase
MGREHRPPLSTRGQEEDHVSEQVLRAFQDNADALQDAASGLEGLEQSAVTVLGRAKAITACALEVDEKAGNAGKILDALQRSLAEMRHMSALLATLSDSMDALQRRTGVVQEIAFQSNILAINASIEAARAGEHGNGFAVVANSMRELSMQSKEAAEEIGKALRDSRTQLANLSTSTETTVANNATQVEESIVCFSAMAEAASGIRTEAEEVRAELERQAQLAVATREGIQRRNEDQARVVSDVVGLLTGAVIHELSPREAQARQREFVVIDVRSRKEWDSELGHLEGSNLLPIDDDFVPKLLSRFAPSRPTLFLCRRGGRSARAARPAQSAGFTTLYNLTGGIEAWHDARLPVRLSRGN